MLSLQQLRVLRAVDQAGSLNKAAQELGYGVPTIQHHLNTIEAHFGIALVERTTRGAKLTEMGRLVSGESAQTLANLERLEKVVAEYRSAGMHTIRVGTFSSIGARLIPEAMRVLDARMSVRLEVIEDEPSAVLRMLANGEVDAGLIYDFDGHPEQIPEMLASVQLIQEPYRVLVGRNSSYAHEKELDFTQLKDAPWVRSRYPDSASDRVIEQACRACGYQPRELIRTDDLTMIHGLVGAGLGLALTTRAAIDVGHTDVELRPTVQDLGSQRVWFVRPVGEPLAAVAQLEEIIRDQAARLLAHYSAKLD